MPYVIVALLVLLADQLSKYLITMHIPLNEGVIDVIPGVLALRNIHNYGAAFGILQNARWFFLAVTVLLFVAAAYAFSKRIIHSKSTRWLAVLVLAGALGNAIDRLIHGYVVDMFQFVFLKRFAVFNVADIFITCGTLLFCLLMLFEKEQKEQSNVPKAKKKKTTLTPARTERCPDAVPSINADAADSDVEAEIAAVFDAFSERTAATAPQPKLSASAAFSAEEAPLPAPEAILEEASDPAAEEPNVPTTPAASLEPEPVVEAGSPVSAEETLDLLADVADPDNSIPNDPVLEPDAVPYDDNLPLDSSEEEVFTLADILAEFSDSEY